MKLGRDMIKKAIEIKPNAHFGREKYQLLLMEWILNPPQNKADSNLNDFLNFIDLRSYNGEDLVKSSNYPDAITGLSGLVVLGDAWNSFDVFYALSHALNAKGDTAISELARQRSLELMNKGRASLYPNFELKSSSDSMPSLGRVQEASAIHDLYLRLRTDAVSYQYLRETYMNERLRENIHPDTHPDFWKGWKEPELPSLEMPDSAKAKREETIKAIKQIGGYSLVILTALCMGVLIGRRANRQ